MIETKDQARQKWARNVCLTFDSVYVNKLCLCYPL